MHQRSVTKVAPAFSFLFSFLLLFFFLSFCKSEPIQYDLSVLKTQLDQTSAQNKKLIIIFGASWCSDCNSLDRMLGETKIKELIERKFIIQKIDVGRFDKNLDINEKLGDPIDNGIPALIILDPTKSNPVIANTTGGEFSNASKMSSEQVFNYLNQF